MNKGIEDTPEWKKNNVETNRPGGICLKCHETLKVYHCENMGCRYCSSCGSGIKKK